MNVGFKLSLTFLILALFFAFAENARQVTFFKDWWITFAWLTLIAAVLGAIMKVWEKKS